MAEISISSKRRYFAMAADRGRSGNFQTHEQAHDFLMRNGACGVIVHRSGRRTLRVVDSVGWAAPPDVEPRQMFGVRELCRELMGIV